jgi:hypothetical protein
MHSGAAPLITTALDNRRARTAPARSALKKSFPLSAPPPIGTRGPYASTTSFFPLSVPCRAADFEVAGPVHLGRFRQFRVEPGNRRGGPCQFLHEALTDGRFSR